MADNKLKFLDIVGLTQLVSEIKKRIDNTVNEATTKTLIGDVTFDNTDGKITIPQGTDNTKTVTLDFATTDKNGLMTKEQVTELARLNTAKLDKVALRIDGKQNASLFSTTTVKVDNIDTQVAVIDYTTNLSNLTNDQKIQAPTAGAVATALDTKADKEAYENTVAALEKSIADNKSAADQALALKVDKSTYDTEKAAINTSITDGLALKVDKTTYNDDKQAQKTKDEGQDALIARHEDMLYKTGTSSTNVYNKTEVKEAIAGVKAEILGGDITQALKDYDTIKEIAEWITNDETGAANLTSTVATLKSTTEGHTRAIEDLQSDVDTIFGTDGKGGLIGGLDTRLGTAETDIENLEKELDTANTGVKARLTTLETELNTTNTGIKARLDTAEDEIDQLQSDYEDVKDALDTINGTNSGLALKADKTAAVGSIEELEWNGNTNAYEMVYKSVAGVEINRISFPVFTAKDITDLFA